MTNGKLTPRELAVKEVLDRYAQEALAKKRQNLEHVEQRLKQIQESYAPLLKEIEDLKREQRALVVEIEAAQKLANEIVQTIEIKRQPSRGMCS